MNKKGNIDVEQGSNTIVAVFFAAILIAVFLLVLVILFGTVQTANLASGSVVTQTVLNETGAFSNSSGYTVANAGVYSFANPTITAAWNATSGAVVNTGNFSLSSTGVLKNASVVTYDLLTSLNIRYTYTTNSKSVNGLNSNLTGIQNNIISMVINFFSLMPTVGIILAVVVLIAVIVLLILYVRRMSANKVEVQGFQG